MSTGKKSIYELHIPTTMSVVWRHVFNNSRCQNKTLPNIILKCFSLTKKSELVQAECSWFVHEVDQVYCQRPGMQSGMYMCNINILSIAYSIHVMYSTLWFQVKTRHYDIRDFLFYSEHCSSFIYTMYLSVIVLTKSWRASVDKKSVNVCEYGSLFLTAMVFWSNKYMCNTRQNTVAKKT